MGAVKNFYHDEICGVTDIARDAPDLRTAARRVLARKVGRAKYVTDILDGKWDDTPAFRITYGEVFLADAQPSQVQA